MSGLANAAWPESTGALLSPRQDRIQYITPPVRAMYVPRAEHRSLAVTELIEHEQMIARAPKVTVVRRSLLFSMYRTLRTVHVQNHPSVAGHSSVHPLSVQSIQPFHVAVLGKHLGFEPAHGVGAGGRSVSVSPPTMIRIVGSWASLSASYCTPTEGPPIGGRLFRQSQCIVLAARSVRGLAPRNSNRTRC